MTGYWFKPKLYGYGATPSTWQGWAVSAVYSVFVIVFVVFMSGQERSTGSTVAAWAILAATTILLIYVSWTKTDGVWRWRWGQND